MNDKAFKLPLKTRLTLFKRKILTKAHLIKTAILSSDSIGEMAFVLGYQQFEMPRALRKLTAKTKFHRDWLSGYTGAGIVTVEERFTSEVTTC